jgi:hypothetical protein
MERSSACMQVTRYTTYPVTIAVKCHVEMEFLLLQQSNFNGFYQCNDIKRTMRQWFFTTTPAIQIHRGIIISQFKA